MSQETSSPHASAAVAAPLIGGFVRPGFEAVREQFLENLQSRGDEGSAFAASVGGEVVVDLWGGWRDSLGGRPWERNTAAAIFSGTKGLVATCVLMLAERQLIDLDGPVAAYWPEFAAEGKQDITVLDVLSHKAGLPGIITPVSLHDATDPRKMAELIALQPAIAPPGRQFNYHALTFGWICAELIQRVDGRGIGRFFQEEIARPLDLSVWIGLPPHLHERVATLGPMSSSYTGMTGAPIQDDDPLSWSVWRNPPRHAVTPLPGNTTAWREAEIPGTGGIATARSMMCFYTHLIGTAENSIPPFIRPKTLEFAQQIQTRDIEPTLRKEMVFGAGYELQSSRHLFGPAASAFGHTGAGGSIHGAWPEDGTAFSFVTRTLREDPDERDPRAVSLLQALHASLD